MRHQLRLFPCVLAAALCGGSAAAAAPCTPGKFVEIGTHQVVREQGVLLYSGGLAIDADGAPDAYSPEGRGLDHLANAGKPGNWFGVVTDTGRADGTPLVQGPADPQPGFYVSPTALEDRSRPVGDPRRYVDSGKIPYLAVPPRLLASKTPGGVKLGDVAAVLRGDKVVFALVADVGPREKLGEGSIALAEGLGVPSSPKRGGVPGGLITLLFPGSGSRRPLSPAEIDARGRAALEAFGGAGRAVGCLGEAADFR